MPDHTPPALFRILLPARDLEAAKRFYEELLGSPGRRVAAGRYYFDVGPVILGILDYSGPREKEIATAVEATYLSTRDLETVHRRAKRLGSLSIGLVHDDPAQPLGEIVQRPWGELSFYAEDPTGNALCFVAAGTEFTGTKAQVAALEKAVGRRAT